MNDLDICKRIAEIEGLEFYLLESGEDTYPLIKVWSDSVLVGKDIPKRFFTAHDYNVVTNDALCFQLMVKYEVDVEFSDNSVCCPCGCDEDKKPHKNLKPLFACKNFTDGGKPNKAICLAIIEAHKEQ